MIHLYAQFQTQIGLIGIEDDYDSLKEGVEKIRQFLVRTENLRVANSAVEIKNTFQTKDNTYMTETVAVFQMPRNYWVFFSENESLQITMKENT